MKKILLMIAASVLISGCYVPYPDIGVRDSQYRSSYYRTQTKRKIRVYYKHERRCKRRNPRTYRKVCKTVLIKHKS